jgi:succinate dehydrogenase / fumarate reductase cytochrome b subunit
MSQHGILKNVVGKKLIMGLTGIFLVSFLVVHVGINACALVNDDGYTFNTAAEFMASNFFIRTAEWGLFLGLLIHVFDAAVLTLHNRKSRPVAYAKMDGKANSTWYSRSMGILGTLLLIFLIVHLAHFWVKSRFTGLEDQLYNNGTILPDLYKQMSDTFQSLWVVILYTVAQFSLAYHLLHGFPSAFHTLGISHPKYNPLIKIVGITFSIVVPTLFAIIPVVLYLRSNHLINF